ncbi:2-C-methyl-D-erythritol 4-phosphate cytidylyltransferase [Caloramator quimbayensis]|uniref:2-C-methyl-D-erythritol 4-phosphate cytidylyltransferase n=1 Tax=Caloramator quimbayensis TaxID=1147123 RepID=A0A1T4Y3J8_9CLOT|nr:2-C-methyl-D-erythritol 4-phosphate cytidylyltransferase [Caloramator quimbayensis]SKA96068.1 2-C-methyl-D-erythritol 4-phosphate cytidylyltransferase [Caloramator quimbayensis]
MVSAVIVAGGKGERMGYDIPKQYINIKGREILAITLDAFESCESIDEIILVVPESYIDFCLKNIVEKYCFKKVKKVVKGGLSRQESVYNGLLNCNPHCEVVVIHDGVRPFIQENIIQKSIEGAKKFGACAVGVYVKDTIKVVDDEKFIVSTLKRDELISIQTPQTFKYDLILKSHEYAKQNNITATDDCALSEGYGCKVKIIEGDYFNIKITTREDIIIARAIYDSLLKNFKEEQNENWSRL